MGHIQGPIAIQFEKLSPTAPSLTQLYNSDPKLWTCAFIDFKIDINKKNHANCKQGKHNLADCPKEITPQNITYQFDLPVYSISLN